MTILSLKKKKKTFDNSSQVMYSRQSKKKSYVFSQKIVNLCKIDTSRYFRAFILLNITHFMIYIYIYRERERERERERGF